VYAYICVFNSFVIYVQCFVLNVGDRVYAHSNGVYCGKSNERIVYDN